MNTPVPISNSTHSMVRDPQSGAILCVDRKAKDVYLKQRNRRKSMESRIHTLEEKIETYSVLLGKIAEKLGVN